MAPSAEQLENRLGQRQAKIGVIGMGYVGLPLALAFAEKEFATTGFDTDETKVEALLAGQSYIKHIPAARIARQRELGQLSATAQFSEITGMDAIIICVPTPLTGKREPDLSFVVATARMIVPHLRQGQLVVLESTTYPGTTREVVRPILEETGLKSGEDFFLAYSPEREDPGNEAHSTGTIPKIVGGDGERALNIARALYDQIIVETVPVSSVDVAEAVKLTENIFRSVNIALVNELKLIYGKMDIDIWEVIEAAKSKPFGYMPFYPGPGLGGHCIPIDPFYLTWRANQFDQPTRFIELAGEINTAMPEMVIQALAGALASRFDEKLTGAHILLLGLSYKKNVDDTRESPAFRLMELLEAVGARVDYHDPHVGQIPMTREHSALAGRQSVDWVPEEFSKYGAALICTDHDGVDYAALVASCRLVVDTRNATRDVTGGRDIIIKA